MNDDPNQIANHLIAQHGAEGALRSVQEGITMAHADGDNYRLSVWREVKRALQNNTDLADNQEAPAD
jgi:hypothetical protein